MAVQGGFILNLLNTAHGDAVEMRALKATTTDDRPMRKFNFASDAEKSEIRHVLMPVRGRLAGGPGATERLLRRRAGRQGSRHRRPAQDQPDRAGAIAGAGPAATE